MFGTVDKSQWTATQLLRNRPENRKTFNYEQRTRIVDCATFLCKHYQEGFVVPLKPEMDDDTTRRQLAAQGYVFTEIKSPADHLIAANPKGTKFLYFPPGQRCLPSRVVPHRMQLDEAPKLTVVGGDWRGNPRGESYTHTSVDSWADDLQSTTESLRTEIEKG